MCPRIEKYAAIDPSVHFRDLRYTFATLAVQIGVDVKTLASMLGHYSAGFTLDTYTRVTSKMRLGATDKFGGVMDTAAMFVKATEKTACA